MKKHSPALSRRYLAALRAHLGPRRPKGAAAARALGRDLLSSGCDTLDLARLHEHALVALASSHDLADARNGLIRRAGNFYIKVLVPLEKARRATREALQQSQQRAAAIRLQAAALAKGNRQLQREVARRRAGEESVKQGRAQIQQLFVQSQAMQKKLRHMARQIISAQENERREISHELHDDIAQLLIAINVELATLGRTPSIGRRALQSRINFTQRLVEKAVKAVHQFARELRPALMDDLGLIPALQAFMERLAARKKLLIHLTAFAGVEALDSTRRTVLFRVAQEALTNVARHARASTVNMIISAVPGAVRMEVNDDGKSFQVLRALSSRTSKRLGLVGMRERVGMVGGTLAIESAPGQGTSVRVEIPSRPGGAG